MKKKLFSLVLGVVLLILVGSSDTGAKSALKKDYLTPSEMKSGLSEKELKRATPLEKKKKNTDDIGMPIKGGKNKSSNIDPKSYPNVNQYIFNHNYQRPGITTELHTFSMFNYGTSDKRPTGVVVHYTANPNNFSARSEADYEINGGWRSAFVHTFIDAGTILNIHDTNYGAWGCGPVGNNYFTQFEMVTARNFDDFAKTTSYSAWYTAYLLNKYNLIPSMAQSNGKGTIWSHHDVTKYLGGTDHTDPTAYFAKYGYSMSQFYELVKYYYYNQDTLNIGNIDSAGVSGNKVSVRGWHLAQQSKSRQYSYIFLLDPSTRREISRVKVDRARRDDVYNAYPNVTNSRYSGFETSFKITPNMYGKKYIVMSRYSSDPKGDKDSIDFTYRNQIQMPKSVNLGDQDSFSLNGNILSSRGWHISSQTPGKPYSYIFLMDANTNREIERIQTNRETRQDVNRAYPDVENSINSGFNVNFDVSKLNDKKVYIMSRYSSDPMGNKDFVDYLYTKKVIKIQTKADTLEEFSANASTIHARGWQIDNNSQGKPYSYAFLIDASTGREVTRQKIDRINRPDVAKAYPTIYNSAQSGYEFEFSVNDSMRGKSYRIIVRYTNDPAGNGSFADAAYSKTVTVPDWEKGKNLGDQDKFSVSGNTINTRGWHVSSDSTGKKYSYLFLMDAKTNREIKRVKINRENRADVNKVYPNIVNSANSGFSQSFTIDDEVRGRQVYLMSRYTNDVNGNGSSVVDYPYTKRTLTIPDYSKGNYGDQDNFSISGNTINARGWHISSETSNKPYSYLFLMDAKTNREITRVKINRESRADVNRVYPNIVNSINSGFSQSFTIDSKLRGKQIYLMSRYTNDVNGNGSSVVDYPYIKKILTVK